MRIVAGRYIAGETLEEALDELRANRDQGFGGILDELGEEVESAEAARKVAASYRRSATILAEQELDTYVSIKPTHLGLHIDEELAFELYSEVAEHCASLGRHVRVEMEDHTTTDATLRIFERLRREHDNVGVVLQSRLLRTPADIDALAPGPVSVRMVKGIYLEPSDIAHVEPDPIREAYVECSRQLLERGAHVAFATHDDVLADRLIALVKDLGLGPERYEFEVLMGIQRHLWEQWRDDGHRVRVYVPYGPEWRAYSLRRLKRNPEIFRHVARNMFRRDP